MKPTIETDRYALYHADCRDVLPTLEAGSVDVVVADIPYGKVSRASGGLRNLDKGLADTETFGTAFVVEQSARLCKSAYIWCGTEQVSDIRRGFVEAGMTTRMCGWEKSNPSPMNGEHLWLSSFECCVFARHSGAWFGKFCKSPVWRGPIEQDQLHPTQKPVWLLKNAVEASAQPDGSVLDFCMGSGTTGVAAMKMGRRFIGIEIDEKYFKIAARRIEEAANHLFAGTQ